MNLPKIANRNEVILVDDNELEHLIIQTYYEDAGFKQPLLHFNDGADFLSYMEKVATKKAPMPAIILLDAQMPGMDGFEILKKLRQRSELLVNLVVLILSTSDAPSDRKKAEDCGANGYRTKPYGINELDVFFKTLLGPA